MKQKLIFTNMVGQAIDALVGELGNPDVVVITDTGTKQAVMPLLVNDSEAVGTAKVITVPDGDENKNIGSLASIWQGLSDAKSTRRTVAVLVGGGMITDMGGFAAACFKRGMRCINVPTTLLGAVDASVGGKTAINFNGVKNQIGSFTEPEAAIISTLFFNTLPERQLLSGYAEMLKHALLENNEALSRVLRFSPVYPTFDSEALLPLLEQSVMVKKNIVDSDPTEQHLRKALNLGHTVGHAFESLAFARKAPIPHGYAVAWGLVAELVLSNMRLGFPSDTLHKVAAYIKENYGSFAIDCKDYPALIEAMRQDKKNASADEINFTLLKAVGNVQLDYTAGEAEIESALDIYRDLMGV